MNNTGIEDEVIEAWAGQRNGMAEKTKSKNFNFSLNLGVKNLIVKKVKYL